MGKKFQIFFFNFLGCLLSHVLSLFGHNFCSLVPIEKKIILLWSLSIFLSSLKILKNEDRNSAHSYLLKILFVSQRDNGLLGVKDLGG